MQLKIELSALKINQYLFQLSGRIEKSSRFIGPNILYSNVSERIESKYLDNESNNNILVPTKRNLGFSQCNIYLTQALEKTSMPS